MHKLILSLALLALPAAATECIVPSKPGGAMYLTCKLAEAALKADPKAKPVHLSYLPGGIGEVAWQSLASRRSADTDTLVAFSGGSLLNIAQGKFGKASAADVRWVAALGADYGMIAVRSDSPYHDLASLVAALRKNPEKVLIGVSGTIGSQDWLKMARLAQQSGIDPKVLRFVALEGGGEAFTAMLANYVQVVSGDASEATLYAGPGKVRVLAVLSEKRLPGVLAGVPTAREQGVDLVWPVIRGLWMSPRVPQAEYQHWVDTFERLMATPEFTREREAHGFYPFSLTGAALTDHVHKAVDDYRRQARQFKLVR